MPYGGFCERVNKTIHGRIVLWLYAIVNVWIYEFMKVLMLKVFYQDDGLVEMGKGEDVRGSHVLVAGVQSAGYSAVCYVDGYDLPPTRTSLGCAEVVSARWRCGKFTVHTLSL